MDCQLDISSINAFLHATSKPVRLLAEPAVRHATPHCFDRVPKTVVGLMMQYLFPARCAGEPLLYRFMRVQIWQSRQPSHPAVCEFLYSGHSKGAFDDKKWKDEIDAVYMRVQKSIAMNLFSDFWNNRKYFPTLYHCKAFRYFAPSLAFNKMPCVTFLQRYALDKVGLWSQLGFNVDRRRVIKQDLADLVLKHQHLNLLLQDPMLNSYIRQRVVYMEQQPRAELQSMTERDGFLFPTTSMKVHLITRAVALVSTNDAICRVVYIVLKAIVCTLRECAPYLVNAWVNVFAIRIGFVALRKMVNRTFLAPNMLSKVFGMSECWFWLSALLLSLGNMNFWFYKYTRLNDNFPTRIQNIFYEAIYELKMNRLTRDRRMQNCALITQFLLLRRT